MLLQSHSILIARASKTFVSNVPDKTKANEMFLRVLATLRVL